MQYQRILRVVAGLLLVAGLWTALPAGEQAVLGQTYFENGDGGVGPVPRALQSGQIIHGRQTGAVAVLDNGHVLRLAAGSSAIFEALGNGEVRVAVLAGRLVAANPTGRPLLAGVGSRFTLAPTVQDSVAAEERLLRLDMSARTPEALDADQPPEDGPGRRARSACVESGGSRGSQCNSKSAMTGR